MTRRITLSLLLFGLLIPAAAAGELKAGAFAQDITPTKFPISVNGNMADGRPRGPTTRCTPAAWCSTTARPSSRIVVVR